jgi:hypothetical protein
MNVITDAGGNGNGIKDMHVGCMSFTGYGLRRLRSGIMPTDAVLEK